MKKLLSIIFAAVSTAVMAQAPAFPGAEGHGRYVTGGRGGEVRHVTNLNDSGTGSFREAVSGAAKKIVVFDVSGIIELESDLVIGSNTTIAGQTAPKSGITIRYYTVCPGGDNIIIRFIRFRRGEEKNINDGADATWTRNHTGIILDHCSFSWSIDEVASFYDNRDFTMQWCTIGEGLANPGHSKGEHSYGGIWGGKLASFHHNFIAHVQNRAPRLNGARYGWDGYDKTKYKNTIDAERVDLRNCVIYNWGRGNGAYGGMGGFFNIVNNYYKSGPATKNKTRVFQCGHTTNTNEDSGKAIDPENKHIYGHFYINGNYVTAAQNPENYDWNGVIIDDDYNNTVRDTIQLSSPIETGIVTTHTAIKAYEKVLAFGGASLFRDGVDSRYMKEALNGTTTYIGSATKDGNGETVIHYSGIIDFVRDQGEYTINTQKRLSTFDADGDGIADEWEKANGGDLDRNGFDLDPDKKWYNNLEVYLNSLVEDIMKKENEDAISAVEEYYPAYNKPEQEEDPQPSINSMVKWTFDTGIETTAKVATLSGLATNGIQSATVTLGDELKYNGVYTTSGGLKETKIQQTNAEGTTPTESNAITFSITPSDGYTFQAKSVQFTVSRVSTNNGYLDAKWIDSNGTVTIFTDEKPKRGNNSSGIEDQSPFYSTYSEDLDSDPTTQESKLVINVYNLSFIQDNEEKLKDFGFCNISVEGILTSPTGISTPVTLSPALSTEYYTLGGQRVNATTKGLVIMRQHLVDGTTKTSKVIR